jgi:transposase
MERLNTLLAVNEPLFVAYTLKEQLRSFWMKHSREEGEKFLKQWCLDASLQTSPHLKKVGKVIWSYAKELLNYFAHPISNGRAEGINNKIKTMKRQAYGFRDLEYFKLRLYHLHVQRYSLTG